VKQQLKGTMKNDRSSQTGSLSLNEFRKSAAAATEAERIAQALSNKAALAKRKLKAARKAYKQAKKSARKAARESKRARKLHRIALDHAPSPGRKLARRSKAKSPPERPIKRAGKKAAVRPSGKGAVKRRTRKRGARVSDGGLLSMSASPPAPLPVPGGPVLG
jgi:hypothetical protein